MQATGLRLGLVLAGVMVPMMGFAGDLASHRYEEYEEVTVCASCHVDISRQHQQAMMSQCYVHPWDEIEYFELALPHSRREPKVAEVQAGCMGCHAPLAFLAGDIPPKPPADDTRANEGVSCEVCHSLTGFTGDVPFNFNWITSPGQIKQGTRGEIESAHHESVVNPFLRSAEFCGTCHNEKDPFGQWVKATHLEWKEGPYAEAGIVCQDCHMPPAPGASAEGGPERTDMRQHLFAGAHDPGKLTGAIEVGIHAGAADARPEESVQLVAVVANAKAGHMLPTGSAEERVVWLHVEGRDAGGRTFHLPVDPKGFDGEAYTIASGEAMAYQDIGDIKGLGDFPGLSRDGEIPPGDRIFRLPYLDPKGRMTIAQWNTAAFGPDYRLAPLRAQRETFTWRLPADVARGEMTITAEVYYSRLVSSVAQYLGVPASESEPIRVARATTSFQVL